MGTESEFEPSRVFLYLAADKESCEDEEINMTYKASQDNDAISELLADMMLLSPEITAIVGNAILSFNEQVEDAKEAIIETELGLTFNEEKDEY